MCRESGLDLAGTGVHGVPSSGGRKAQQGQKCALDNGNTGGQEEEEGWGWLWRGTIRLKEDSGQLLRGTGWWLRASHAVNAPAKEAEVQGTAPGRAGARARVRKPGRSQAWKHNALGWRERGGLGTRG